MLAASTPRSPRAPSPSSSTPRCRKASCSACSSRACANISPSSATARPTWARCCASTRRRASPAPSTAATRWRWRMPPRRCAGSTARSPAVVTSIGPGALQAFAGSLAAASNGVGVYHIYGDETTFGEGYNMQQVPKEEQGLFGQMTAHHGPLLRAAHAARPCATRCAADRSPSTIPIAPGRSICCCRSTPSRHASRSISPRCPSAPGLPPLAPASDAPFDEAAQADRRRAQGRDQGRRRHARP